MITKMAALICAIIEAEEVGKSLRKERIFKDRNDVLNITDDICLISRYRFPRDSILRLIDEVKSDVQHATARSHAVPAHIQVLAALRFMTKGGYQSEVADLHGLSQSTVSRCIERVCKAINKNLDNIKFPQGLEELRRIKDGFYRIAQFPNVIGAIDGKLIPIQGMKGEEEPTFVCRKGFHAINVQAVTDHNLKFINVVVRWPGSTHDSFMLSHSGLHSHMERHRPGYLLGDSGYPLKLWLMTPVPNPSTNSQNNYNRAHSTTRNAVERAFGVLKQRFRCLHKTGGALPYKPDKCALIIEAAFRLHNKACEENIPLEEEDPAIYADDLQEQDVFVGQPNSPAQALRSSLIQRF